MMAPPRHNTTKLSLDGVSAETGLMHMTASNAPSRAAQQHKQHHGATKPATSGDTLIAASDLHVRELLKSKEFPTISENCAPYFTVGVGKASKARSRDLF
jgi:hypothetical protein